MKVSNSLSLLCRLLTRLVRKPAVLSSGRRSFSGVVTNLTPLYSDPGSPPGLRACVVSPMAPSTANSSSHCLLSLTFLRHRTDRLRFLLSVPHGKILLRFETAGIGCGAQWVFFPTSQGSVPSVQSLNIKLSPLHTSKLHKN